MKDNNSMNNLIDLIFDPNYVKTVCQLYSTEDVSNLSNEELNNMIETLFSGAKTK